MTGECVSCEHPTTVHYSRCGIKACACAGYRAEQAERTERAPLTALADHIRARLEAAERLAEAARSVVEGGWLGPLEAALEAYREASK